MSFSPSRTTTAPPCCAESLLGGDQHADQIGTAAAAACFDDARKVIVELPPGNCQRLGIHIEHDDPRLTPLVHRVDPLAQQIGKSGEVFRPRQPFGLEAAHLAGRGSLTHGRFAADNPAHRRHNRSASFTSS
jgi:hypothetical protein